MSAFRAPRRPRKAPAGLLAEGYAPDELARCPKGAAHWPALSFIAVCLFTVACSDGTNEPPPEASFTPPKVRWPDPEELEEPFLLSEVGLFRDIEADSLAPDLIAFEPVSVLWSDGAKKRRWVRLPEGETIDTSDMDAWELPVGTVFFKEFTRDGVRVETRAIARLGPERFDYWMGAFVWKDDGSDAVFRPDGEENARGTEHDVPSVKQCGTCHNGEPARALGFTAVQLAASDPPLLPELAARGLLSGVAPEPADIGPSGSTNVRRALGYLHANCGHCHNPKGAARPDTDLTLRLGAERTPAEDTPTYLTALGEAVDSFPGEGVRVVPGDPEASVLLKRMQHRSDNTQMPPLATERIDDDGVASVHDWIRSLAPRTGSVP